VLALSVQGNSKTSGRSGLEEMRTWPQAEEIKVYVPGIQRSSEQVDLMQLRRFGDVPGICYSVSNTVLKGIGEGVIEVQYLIELTRLINKGRCWVVVGAGASCDLGVPSWECLAKQVLSLT